MQRGNLAHPPHSGSSSDPARVHASAAATRARIAPRGLDPIRADLLSPDRLAERAAELARSDRVAPGSHRGTKLLARLEENARVLVSSYREIARTIAEGGVISPAAEWLADNFYIVQDQLRQIRDDLPPGFYRKLPKLADGRLAGAPRIYGIAWTYVEHTDSRIDVDTLRRFVAAYQEVQPLTIGELWALAISLRLVLSENLRRLAEAVVARRKEQESADVLADEILLDKGKSRGESPFRVPSGERLPAAFAVELIERLRDHDPKDTPALRWFHEWLTREGLDRDELVASEHRSQAAMHVSVRNVITSMRLLSAVDWRDFFESVSIVERILRDGTDVSRMDFATRNRYRDAVEELAHGSKLAEEEVARRAVVRGKESGQPLGEVRADPGYYLISHGRREFERDLGYRGSLSQWLRRAWVRWATPGYLGTLGLLTVVLLSLPVAATLALGAGSTAAVLIALLALIPASEIAIAVANLDVVQLLGPRRLPKLELKGIPEEMATIVVVPTMLASDDEALSQVEQLEVRFLANPDGFVYFALLTDWPDSDEETRSGDAALVETARRAIAELNAQHGPAPDGGPRFLLYHRKRLWNPSEGCWMGWERKRGKLGELDRLLRGATDTSFLPGEAPPRTPIRYVITLDADTRLPRGAANELVGAMAHPLNRPVVDPASRRVVDGYGILQPRVTPTLPRVGHGTLFERLFSGPRGIDPYAFAVSDLYQDLFGEGIYTGKGIYDLDVFERSLEGRVPENALLSHDLFEGIFARAGLVTDVEVFEDFPSHYEVAAARQNRWARGDWQLVPWLAPRVPDASGGRTRNPLPPMGIWKILDNLRRSLVAPLSAATLIAGGLLAGAVPLVWVGFIAATIFVPRLLPILAGAIPKRRGVAKRNVAAGLVTDLSLAISYCATSLALLGHQAWLMSDAIVRTLARVFWTRRRLLEWTATARARSEFDLTPLGFVRRNAGAVAIAVLCLVTSLLVRPAGAAPSSVFFFVIWAASPLIAWALSLPPRDAAREPLSRSNELLFRSIARRTWRFFETFSGDQDHHLPPDNVQEDPRRMVAHRTSPTNVGLALLSTVAAHDCGWIGAHEMADRLEATISSAASLERFRGHLFNWYATETLVPLEPRYVSTVDSGNLVANLLVVKQACLETPMSPPDVVLGGIRDALRLFQDSVEAEGSSPPQARSRRDVRAAIREIETRLGPLDPEERLEARLKELAKLADGLERAAPEGAGETGDGEATDAGPDDAGEPLVWARAMKASIASHLRDFAPESSPAAPSRDAYPQMELALARSGREAETAGELSAEFVERERAGFAQADPAAERNEPGGTTALARRLHAIAAASERLAAEMDFEFLFDDSRKLFSIGYRVSDGRLDSGFYDLLASEARLASFLAVARGEVPWSHWFHLGRPLTPVGRGSALVSWSGSMFEYLMPDLVLDVPTDSLLEVSARLAVGRQMRYGSERGVPWGVSESGYNARDVSMNYQYSSFGVSGLGLKRGLADDLVIAPYATALAAMIDPAAAAENFRALEKAGALGRLGFYEAIDYTRSRLPEGSRRAVVKEYMAHHQGMTLVSLANVLTGWQMRRRFHAEALVQSAELLLQERTPRAVSVARPRAEEIGSLRHVREPVAPALRVFQSPHDPTPRAHFLSNGRYSVMVTAAGSGYSRFEGMAVTRWREDPTRDAWGSYVFVRDVQNGKVWSAGHQPSGTEADSYTASYYEDRVEILRRDGNIATTLEVVVSPEDDAELRRVSLMNLGLRTRELELTSYAEIVLNDPGADGAHPAFSNLFVETEFVPELETLVATRRPRSADEARIWAAHVAVVEGSAVGGLQFETDRARFIGRGKDLRTASAAGGHPLSGATGAVLDPIFSLRRRVRLAPGASARVTFSTIVGRDREKLLAAADRHRDPSILERTSTLAWTATQVELRHLQIAADEAHLFQRLATRLVYSDPALRAPADVLARNTRGVAGLWPYGISGDRPIVLVKIDEVEDGGLFRQMLRAQEYWRLKGLSVDLVVLNEEKPSYGSELQATLETTLRTSGYGHASTGRGGVFIVKSSQVPPENRDALASAARIVLSSHSSLAEHVTRSLPRRPASRPPSARPPAAPTREPAMPRPELSCWNGVGGFDERAGEYVTVLGRGDNTPAPWTNVVANPDFGFLVTESGSGFTWAGNSRENQLTPWSNDAVCDPPGEAVFLRDEETGEIWTPTALPIRQDAPYVARHGPGYTRFEHESHDLSVALTVFVDLADPIKVSRLTVENRSPRRRAITVTAYAEWILGVTRSDAARFVVSSFDAATGSLQARNAWSPEFPNHVAFLAFDVAPASFTADRTEFLGRNGRIGLPAGLAPGQSLSGRAGAGLDPCAALQAPLSLPPNGRAEIHIFLGQAKDAAEARRLLSVHRAKNVDESLREIRRMWDGVLGGLQVKTPDSALDLLVNRWLLYQALACRIWGRSAFYQSGGAFGFRDQLQDALALVVPRREILRDQILLSASRQFVEGDVQHWWHPPSGKGVRTRISDDLLWLPFALARYLEVTGDEAILDEKVPFLGGEPLHPDEVERYFAPSPSDQIGDVYEHCARALDRSLPVGAHGLPLMGTGDWNDGMNRVGIGGKGESVWLAWFLRANLEAFAPIAERRGDQARAERWRSTRAALDEAIEREAWDGDWYRRAYFDDGTPLGTSHGPACQIDSIAQSWAVISGGGDPARARTGMNAVDRHLVRRRDGLVLLFTPPFDRAGLDPGYIRGYPPGVRENGGQYTHGALWSVIAFAALGDGDRAGELLSLLNPIQRTRTPTGFHRYMGEPYVIAADVYAEPPHVGRCGWSWYTGSAGWMYRAAVEWILGLRVEKALLRVDPCIPRAWPRFEATLRYHSSRYQITVENPRGASKGVAEIRFDGRRLPDDSDGVPLTDDGGLHRVDVLLGGSG
ncbi:MAG TPA: glucoamylase family protein [Thermoanaerobaculia bacterium]|nr:glucoamylase family protein [Thermoanaerobaculia bacterium]